MKQRTLARLGIASAAAITTLVAVPGPAHAGDLTVNVSINGRLDGRGFYDDYLDNLCARGWNGGATDNPSVDSVRVTIKNQELATTQYDYTKVDYNPRDNDRQCTGNLSIPEDDLYRMTVTVIYVGGAQRSDSDTFRA